MNSVLIKNCRFVFVSWTPTPPPSAHPFSVCQQLQETILSVNILLPAHRSSHQHYHQQLLPQSSQPPPPPPPPPGYLCINLSVTETSVITKQPLKHLKFLTQLRCRCLWILVQSRPGLAERLVLAIRMFAKTQLQICTLRQWAKSKSCPSGNL